MKEIHNNQPYDTLHCFLYYILYVGLFSKRLKYARTVSISVSCEFLRAEFLPNIRGSHHIKDTDSV